MNKAEEKEATPNSDGFANEQNVDQGIIAILIAVLVIFLALLGAAAYIIKSKDKN